MSYETRMQSYVKTIESTLPEFLPPADQMPEQLRDAMHYSLMAGGKRIRPVLALATADLLQADASQSRSVQAYAAAVEMVHTYSLIHDDLPSMDDDVLRRGKPTNHVVYGEAVAILAGDALLSRAFELAGEANVGDFSAQAVLNAWLELARLAGPCGMIGGQVLDLAAEGQEVEETYLKKMQALKTGALLQAPVCGIARLFEAPESIVDALSEYALQVGLAFQIRDDILDSIATEGELGKTPGKDMINQKATYVTLLGKDEAEATLVQANRAALNACGKLAMQGYDADFLIYLAGHLSGRRY